MCIASITLVKMPYYYFLLFFMKQPCPNMMQDNSRSCSRKLHPSLRKKPKFGKAAVFSAKAIGVPDQGAIAGMYMIEGLKRSICK